MMSVTPEYMTAVMVEKERQIERLNRIKMVKEARAATKGRADRSPSRRFRFRQPARA